MFPIADGITHAIRAAFAAMIMPGHRPAVALAYVHTDAQSRTQLSRRGGESGPRWPTDGLN